MGKRTYNNGSHVLKSPPLNPFYIEKDSDYHPNLRHYPDYRRLQFEKYKDDFIPNFFKPIPVKSTYQDDYDINKNETEQFKDFKTIEVAKCVKLQQTRDFDVLMDKNKYMKNTENSIESIDKSDEEEKEKTETQKTERTLRPTKKILRRPPRKPRKFPNLTIYDTTYNRLAKVNDLPELERQAREKQAQKKKNKSIDDKTNYVKFLNRRDDKIYTDESSHFQYVIDDSDVCHPYPNFPAPFSIYPIFHSAKGDFNTTYKVFHNNQKFSISEPDIYQIRRKIFEEEREIINSILKKNNDNIKGNVNVNIYNP